MEKLSDLHASRAGRLDLEGATKRRRAQMIDRDSGLVALICAIVAETPGLKISEVAERIVATQATKWKSVRAACTGIREKMLRGNLPGVTGRKGVEFWRLYTLEAAPDVVDR